MKYLSSLFLLFCLPLLSWSQQFKLITSLPNVIKETSGLIYLNGKLITHNDSDNDPALYEIDTITGNITRTVTVTNASNYDWEDICTDSTYIYIADMGNNNGDRTNLKIYRVLIADYLTSNYVSADIINFSYSDQTDFSTNPYAHNFDAEAIISYHDSLYIFSKNWVDQRTNIYPISKIPGTYQITKTDSFNSQCLVTGGTYNSESNMVVLSGYTLSSPYVMELAGFTFPKFSNGTITKYAVTPPTGYSIQMEAIINTGLNEFFLTTEKRNGDAALYKLTTVNTLSVAFIDSVQDSIFPNPASSTVTITHKGAKRVNFYDLNGAFIFSSSENQIDITTLKTGVYILVIYNANNQIIDSKKLLVKQ